MNVCLTRVDSYGEVDAIREFVHSALTASESVRKALGGRAPVVVIKPNWVQESHEYQPDVWLPVITHPNLIVATIKAIDRIADGPATVCVCDAPHTYADFNKVLQRGALDEALRACQPALRHVSIEILDLRREIWIRKEEVTVERRRNSEDPRGYVAMNLGRDSLFYGFGGEGRYYGADFDDGEVNSHHRGDTHEYLLAGTPMKCDLFINLPKLKTHKKTGITCCLKNLVGINGDKNWLPHHTCGYPSSGGDEYPERGFRNVVEDQLKRVGRRAMRDLPVAGNWLYRKMRNAGKLALGDSETVIRNGNWRGNSTCWRMALDLNRALLYGNADGTWREAGEPKPYFAIVDGIVGGQGNGPICPESVESNVLIAGDNPAAIDAACTWLMGFGPHDFPIVEHAFDKHRCPLANQDLDELMVLDGRINEVVKLTELSPAVEGGFRPHFGWLDVAPSPLDVSPS